VNTYARCHYLERTPEADSSDREMGGPIGEPPAVSHRMFCPILSTFIAIAAPVSTATPLHYGGPFHPPCAVHASPMMLIDCRLTCDSSGVCSRGRACPLSLVSGNGLVRRMAWAERGPGPIVHHILWVTQHRRRPHSNRPLRPVPYSWDPLAGCRDG
jgi:hypothetical protein